MIDLLINIDIDIDASIRYDTSGFYNLIMVKKKNLN